MSNKDKEINELTKLRGELSATNLELLALLNKRAGLVQKVQELKSAKGLPTFVPEREEAMYSDLIAANRGPFSDATIKRLFKHIFRASLDLMEKNKERQLIVCQKEAAETAALPQGPILIAGPCAVESREQAEAVAAFLAKSGVKFIRGGAFKPRSSPYSFQGLGLPGLQILKEAAKSYGLKVVSEIMDPRQIAAAAPLIDIIQVGARNMYNYDLLKELGKLKKPVILKRGLSATIEEWLYAAEYIAKEGNRAIILCERGIRTFEQATRNTLDISAIPLLKEQTKLPVLADLSHAAGRKDLLIPLGKAALAAGADGLMVEVHPSPESALSDAGQQLDFAEFTAWQKAVWPQQGV